MSDIELDYAMARYHRRTQGDALNDDLTAVLRRIGPKPTVDQVSAGVLQWLARTTSYR